MTLKMKKLFCDENAISRFIKILWKTIFPKLGPQYLKYFTQNICATSAFDKNPKNFWKRFLDFH